jgi:hypothetical protein
MITLTAAEARRQFNHATRATRGQDHHQHWSDWRRAHQATARRCHYNRRLQDHRLSL